MMCTRIRKQYKLKGSCKIPAETLIDIAKDVGGIDIFIFDINLTNIVTGKSIHEEIMNLTTINYRIDTDKQKSMSLVEKQSMYYLTKIIIICFTIIFLIM